MVMSTILTGGGASSPGSAGTDLVGTFAARPAAGVGNRIYVVTDGPVDFADDGANWRPMVARPGRLGVQPPAAATFVKEGATAATIADQQGTLLISSAMTGVQGNELFSGPAVGAAFTVVSAHMAMPNVGGVPVGEEPMFALALQTGNASGGKFYRFGVYWTVNAYHAQVQYWTSLNVANGGAKADIDITPFAGPGNRPIWLKVVKDAVNITFSISTDNENFLQVYQEAKDLNNVPDHVGLFVSHANGNAVTHRVYSLSVA